MVGRLTPGLDNEVAAILTSTRAVNPTENIIRKHVCWKQKLIVLSLYLSGTHKYVWRFSNYLTHFFFAIWSSMKKRILCLLQFETLGVSHSGAWITYVLRFGVNLGDIVNVVGCVNMPHSLRWYVRCAAVLSELQTETATHVLPVFAPNRVELSSQLRAQLQQNGVTLIISREVG